MINTIPMPPPEPQPTELTPARAAQIHLGALLRTSKLHGTARLVMWTATDLAATAIDAGETFSISIEELSECTGMPADVVARRVSELVSDGWIRRVDDRWLPFLIGARTGS